MRGEAGKARLVRWLLEVRAMYIYSSNCMSCRVTFPVSEPGIRHCELRALRIGHGNDMCFAAHDGQLKPFCSTVNLSCEDCLDCGHLRVICHQLAEA